MADCARSIVHEPIVRPTEVHHMEKAANRVKIKETRCSNLKERQRRRGRRPPGQVSSVGRVGRVGVALRFSMTGLVKYPTRQRQVDYSKSALNREPRMTYRPLLRNLESGRAKNRPRHTWATLCLL